jgi:hypothetical protein
VEVKATLVGIVGGFGKREMVPDQHLVIPSVKPTEGMRMEQ